MGSIAIVSFEKRHEGAVRSKIKIGNKQIETPAHIPKIKKNIEFNIVCDTEELEQKPKAICFNIHTVFEITRKRRERSKQYCLEMKTIDENYDKLVKETPIIVDPNTEALYFKIPWKTRRKKTIYIKDGILEVLDIPEEAKKILKEMETENYKASLSKLKEGNFMMSFIDAFISYQANNKADIILPPTPLITGTSITFELMEYINGRARKPILQGTKASPCIYLPLHYKIFKRPLHINKIIDYIKANIASYKLLVIKLVWYDNIKSNKTMRIQYGKFLSKIDKIKKEKGNKFSVILLDAGSEGLYTVANGIDGYSEPIDGKITPKRGAKKEEGEEEREIITHGSYLDSSEGYISFTHLLENVEKNNGLLPCSCIACDKYHGKLSKDIDTLEWNISRRAHTINHRRRKIDILSNQVKSGKAEDISWTVDNSEDRNFIDLLPKPDIVVP